MATEERFQETESAVGFRYPSSFVSMFEEFSSLFATDGFRRTFPDTRLLLSVSEIVAARENTPAALLAFMRQEQSSWPDIYAFDLASDGPEFRVVAWSNHAVVMDWQSFPVFFRWVRKQIAKA